MSSATCCRLLARPSASLLSFVKSCATPPCEETRHAPQRNAEARRDIEMALLSDDGRLLVTTHDEDGVRLIRGKSLTGAMISH